MNEQKNSESRTFKILMTIMVMMGIIMIITLLHLYLFLCFEWAQYKGNIITDIISKENFNESMISENQISGIYEYKRASHYDDSDKIHSIVFTLSGTEYDRHSYSDSEYLDNILRLDANNYEAFKNFQENFGEDFLYDFKFSNGHLMYCTVLDKKTGKVLGNPREISWEELHNMISE